MKHASKGQLFGTLILLCCIVLTCAVPFASLRTAISLVAIIVTLGLWYLTILVHPLLKQKTKVSGHKTTVHEKEEYI